jgi:crossover junction endodeoxyribonuclease RuvC
MTIIGIDPGTLVAGYAVIATGSEDGKTTSGVRLIEYGEITMSGNTALPARLHKLFEKLSAVIERTSPDVLAIESAFTHKNVRSAMLIGHARGVALLAASQAGISVSEYAPREVKKAVTGSGAASKEQVQFMVCSALKLARPPKSFDASDAMAVALCHYQRARLAGKTVRKGAGNSWKEFIKANPERVVKKP